MKKKVIALLLFAAMLLVFLTGCNADVETAPTAESFPQFLILETETIAPPDELFEPAKNVKLKFRPTNSTFSIENFGDEFFVYRFDSPNEHIIVYEISNSVYLVGSADSEIGQCYALYRMPNGDFIGLSSNYMLFNTIQGLVAVEINQTMYVLEKTIGKQISFDELSEEEKNSFVSPFSYEKINQ